MWIYQISDVYVLVRVERCLNGIQHIAASRYGRHSTFGRVHHFRDFDDRFLIVVFAEIVRHPRYVYLFWIWKKEKTNLKRVFKKKKNFDIIKFYYLPSGRVLVLSSTSLMLRIRMYILKYSFLDNWFLLLFRSAYILENTYVYIIIII